MDHKPPPASRLFRGRGLFLGARGKRIFLHGSDGTAMEAARREHSRKPEEFRALVEKICPGSRVELFAGQQRDGWRVYGNQIALFGIQASNPKPKK